MSHRSLLTQTLILLIGLITAGLPARGATAPVKPDLYGPVNHEAAYPDLMILFQWKLGTGANDKYDVYLGTTTGNMHAIANNASGEYYDDSCIFYISNDTVSLFFLNLLERRTTYYWKVVVRDGAGQTAESDVRSFTTGNPNIFAPETPVYLLPALNASGIAPNPVLKWRKTIDADGDTPTYDVYLSTFSQPATLVASDLTDTSFTVTATLKGNTDYYWKVVARDPTNKETTGDVWKFSTRNTPPPVVVPLSPVQQATGVDYNTLFSWQQALDADGDGVTYELWYGTGAVPDIKIVVTGTTVTLPLAAAATYSWKVIAIDSRGERSESPVWTFTTRSNAGNAAPTQPALLAPANNSTGVLFQQALQWNAATDNNGDPVTYTLYLSTSADKLTQVASALTATSFLPNLVVNTTYYWKVTATDGKGGSTSSAVWTFTTTTDDVGLSGLSVYYRYSDPTQAYKYEPATLSPSFSIATPQYTTRCKTTFKDAVAIVLDYSNPNTSVSFDLPAGFTATSPVIYNYGLPNATVAYMITGAFAAHNLITVHLQVGAVIRSYTIDAQVNELPGKPILLTPEVDKVNVSLTPELTWTGGNDADGGAITYRIFIGTSPTQLSARGLSNNQRFTVAPALAGNQRYYWKVVAVDADNEVAESDVFSFATQAGPQLAVPVLHYPRELSTYVETNLTLVWRGTGDPATVYDVYLGNTFQPQRIAQGVAGNSFTTTGLTYNTTYYWKVVAINQQGQSVTTTVRQFITQPEKANETGIFTDVRDGEMYQWVNINGQQWLTHNLAYLPKEKDGYFGYEYWKDANRFKNYTTFNNSISNLSKYGYLYNWEAALNFDAITDDAAPIQGVCPCGWRVATTDDWQQLYPLNSDKAAMIHYSNWAVAGKETEWTNSSGLSLLQSGFYSGYNGAFESGDTQFWLAQRDRKTSRTMGFYWTGPLNGLISNSNNTYGASSVRCIRNKTGNHPPTAPVLQSPANNSQGLPVSNLFQWLAATDADGDALTYELLIDTLPQPVAIPATALATLNYTFSNLISNKTYYWKVRARDIHGEIAESAVFTFTTQANSNNVAPAAPQLLQPAHQNTGVPVTSTVLQWTPATDANGDAITYTVYFGKQQAAPQLVAQGITATTWPLNNLQAGIAYYWKVVASDGQGGITASVTNSFTTLNRAPTAPVLLSPVDGLQGTPDDIGLSWQAATDPDGDNVYYKVLWGPTPGQFISPESPNRYYSMGSFALNQNTVYYWQVIALDGKGGETASEVRTFKIFRNVYLTRLELVSPVNYALNVPATPKLTWKKPAGDFVSYDVYLSDGTGNSLVGTNITDTFFTVTQFNGANLRPHVPYIWRVVAKDAFGNIIESDFWRITIVNGLPGKPVLTAPANGATGIPNSTTLSWTQVTDADGDPLAYDLYFGTDPNPSTLLATVAKTGQYNVTQLTTNTTYYWKVVARDGSGGQTASDIGSFAIQNSGQNIAPAAPTLISPLAYTSNVTAAAGLSWQAAVDPDGDAVVYDVYLSTNAALPAPVATGLTSLQYMPAFLINSVTYYWKVVAHDGRGGATASAVWSFTSKNNLPTVPVLVSPVSGTILTNTTTALSWTAAQDADNDPLVYDVYLGKDQQPVNLVANGLTTFSYTTPVIDNNGIYYWKIVARDPFGAQTSSEVWSFTGRNEAPSAPVLQTPANSGTIAGVVGSLTWNASTDIDSDPIGYEVYIGTSPTAFQKYGTVYGTSFTTPALAAQTTYYWKIVAKDQQKGTATSTTWSFVSQQAVPNQPPTIPALLAPAHQATGLNAQQVVFSWAAATDPDNDPVTYDLYLSANAQADVKIASSLTSTGYTVNNLLAGTTYTWKVVANDDHGHAQPSVINGFTTAQAAPVTYTISGTITDQTGKPVPDVTLIGFSSVAVTNASGVYTTVVPVGWSGTVNPVLSGFGFSPLNRTFTNVQANTNTQHFTATVITATNDPVLDAQIKIYPNPTTGPVEISLPESLTDWYLELYDAKGTLIYSKKASGLIRTWQLYLPSKGVFMLKLKNRQRVVVRKVVVL